jgi:hypothetical protein
LQIKTNIVSCHTADSKPVKQEVNGTVILPPLVFPAPQILVPGDRLAKSEDGRTHPLKVSQKLTIIFGEIKKNCATTLNRTTLTRIPLSITNLNIPFSITSFGIMTLSIMTFGDTIISSDTIMNSVCV